MIETIFTIGHSTHPFDEFLDILKVFYIEMVADVRTIPNPGIIHNSILIV